MASSSDEDYDPLVESLSSETDTDSTDDELVDSEDISDLDDNVLESGFRLISDIFGDRRPDPIPPFTSEYSGINPLLTGAELSEPGAAFQQFFDDELVNAMCRWINEKADVFFQKNPQKKGKVHGLIWKAVTSGDVYTFLALLMVMGITHIPRYPMYWRKDIQVYGPPCFCKEVMSRDRFLSIMKFLRFSSAQQVRKDKPSTRIEPYLEMLRERCQWVMRPGKNFAVDEALILWKGRLSFRQFIKTKRSRFGIKAFMLCPSDKTWNGYSWNFVIYYGKDSFTPDEPLASALSLSERIVVYIMKDLIDEGRQVFTDNWYTSLRLAEYLLTRKTLITGVVRAGRGPPKELVDQPLSKRQSCFARKGNTLIVKYQDRSQVTVLTTKYEANMVEKCRVYFGNKVDFYNKPLHIDKYNTRMGSVDFADQMLEPYETNRKSLAWFKKIGIHFMFRMLLNSYITCKAVGNYKHDFMQFILHTSRDLFRQFNNGARQLFDAPANQPRPKLPAGHILEKVEGGKQKRCRVCAPKRKDTRFHCPACPKQPGLCSMDHYLEWHKSSDEDADEPKPSTSGKRKR